MSLAVVEPSMISTLAIGLGLALAFGYAAQRLRLPPLVGYILAGILVGPATPGFVADAPVTRQFSEIGVMLLLFGVGLHFSPFDLLKVRRIVLPAALVQMVLTTSTGALLALCWGWPPRAAFTLGLCLSMASTVVLIKALEARGEIDGPFGKLAMGWLVVEDFVAIALLVILPALSPQPGAQSAGGGILRALGLTATFVALMLVGGRRLFPAILWRVARTGSRELFTLSVVVIAIGIAYGAGRIFGVSYALGAFLSGMVLRESDYSHRAAERVLPLQDAFSVLFFVSVGMLFDPRIFWHHPLQVLGISTVVVLGKFLWGGFTLLVRGQPAAIALAMGAGIAQVGEFSFILAEMGTRIGLLPDTAMNLVLAAAIVSISLNSTMRLGVEPLSSWLRRIRPAWAQGGPGDPLSALPASTPLQFLTGQVVLVGYESLGAKIAEALLVRAVPFVVVDESGARVEELRGRGLPAVRGDAAEPGVLVQAHIARAGMLVATKSDAVRDASMIRTARKLNPSVELVFHVDSTEDAERLRKEGCTTFLSEDSLAHDMSDHVAARFGKEVPAAT